MNEVTLANMALYRAGSSARITTLDENVERNENVRQAAFWYPLVRDEVLQSFPWSFARKSVALAEVTDITYPGWSFVYQLPSDCLQPVALCPEGGLRTSFCWLTWCGFMDSPLAFPKVPYEIMTSADEQSSVIVTDLEEAFLYYIFRQTVSSTWTPLFCHAFAWKLGAELANALQTKADRFDKCMRMYEGTVARAAAQMMNASYPDPKPDSPSIQARAW